MSPFIIYLVLTVVPGIKGFLIFSALFTLIAGIVTTVRYADERDKALEKIYKRNYKRWFTALLVIILVISLIPSRNELVACIVIPKIANSEIITDLPEDLTQVYNLGMDKLIEELTPEKL